MKLNDILLISMIFIDLYLCYYIFEGCLSNNSIDSLSSLVKKVSMEFLLRYVLILNFLSFIYELNIKHSYFLCLLFMSFINICVLGTLLFRYDIFPTEHYIFAILLFLSILLYMIFSARLYNYKLVYIQIILSIYSIYKIQDSTSNSDIYIIEIMLLLNFALFYLIRHIYS